jgi:hypothetical protein
LAKFVFLEKKIKPINQFGADRSIDQFGADRSIDQFDADRSINSEPINQSINLTFSFPKILDNNSSFREFSAQYASKGGG